MKHFKFLVLGMLVCLSIPALAEFTTITRAHEVALSEFRTPASVNGTTAFKSCDDCERFTIRVTPDTRYTLNNRSVPLADFRAALSKVTSREDETVIVMHHLESNTVTAISISL